MALSFLGVKRQIDLEKQEPEYTGIHSICLVVEGGDNAAIAEAIALKKTPGCYTLGDVEVMTRDAKGLPNAIRFYRPKAIRVRLRVTLNPLAGYLSTTGSAIKTNLAGYINAMAIGDDVLASRLLTPINAADASGLTCPQKTGPPKKLV